MTEQSRPASFADHCRVLDVSDDATEADLKSAYRRLALQLHPDKNSSPDANEMFGQITRSYAYLLDRLATGGHEPSSQHHHREPPPQPWEWETRQGQGQGQGRRRKKGKKHSNNRKYERRQRNKRNHKYRMQDDDDDNERKEEAVRHLLRVMRAMLDRERRELDEGKNRCGHCGCVMMFWSMIVLLVCGCIQAAIFISLHRRKLY